MSRNQSHQEEQEKAVKTEEKALKEAVVKKSYPKGKALISKSDNESSNS